MSLISESVFRIESDWPMRRPHLPWWLGKLAPGFGCKYAVSVNLGGLGPLGALHDPWVLRKPRMNPHA